MPQTIRFHLDEHCSPSIARGLRRRGIDVTTAKEAGLLSAEDEKHVHFALHEDRMVLTRDSDFLRWHSNGGEHAGIIYCPRQSHSIGEIIRGLVLIWEVYDAEDMRNRVEYL